MILIGAIKYCQEHDMHMIRLPWCPWLKGRMLSPMCKPEPEVAAEFEKAIVAATKMEAPLFTALALHDMLALCPAESARRRVVVLRGGVLRPHDGRALANAGAPGERLAVRLVDL